MNEVEVQYVGTDYDGRYLFAFAVPGETSLDEIYVMAMNLPLNSQWFHDHLAKESPCLFLLDVDEDGSMIFRKPVTNYFSTGIVLRTQQ